MKLEKSVSQYSMMTKKLSIDKSFTFDEIKDNQKIFIWLSYIKTQYKISTIISRMTFIKEEKIIVTIFYLNNIFYYQYNIKIIKNKEFDIYNTFEKWIRKSYVSQNMFVKYWDEYWDIRQKNNESIEYYQLCFTEFVNKFDKYIDESFQVSDFIHEL